jgi:RNA polymerase sigma-70 factor, ECF subfamily
MERGPEETANLPEHRLTSDDVRKLYAAHGPALVAYACSFAADAAAAEDVVHQVFLRLLRGDTVTPDAPVAYLYRAVRNAALNARRNGSREVPLETEAACFEHRGSNREAAMALQSALSALPEEQREVVVMRIWSGMTLEDVANATGVSLNTAASRYRYALEKLRERLKPYQRLGPGRNKHGSA